MPKSDTWFTPANAKEMSARAHAAKQERWNNLQQAAQDAENTPATPELDFAAKRLIRVRIQLNMVDKELDDLINDPDADPKRTKNLLEMQHRLNAQERELSMRPAPGTTKPSTAKQPKSRASHESQILFEEAPAKPINDQNEQKG